MSSQCTSAFCFDFHVKRSSLGIGLIRNLFLASGAQHGALPGRFGTKEY